MYQRQAEADGNWRESLGSSPMRYIEESLKGLECQKNWPFWNELIHDIGFWQG